MHTHRRRDKEQSALIHAFKFYSGRHKIYLQQVNHTSSNTETKKSPEKIIVWENAPMHRQEVGNLGHLPVDVKTFPSMVTSELLLHHE